MRPARLEFSFRSCPGRTFRRKHRLPAHWNPKLSQVHSYPRDCAAQNAGPNPLSPTLRIHPEEDEDRDEVEHFIRTTFRARFGAEVRTFAPCLVSLRDRSGNIAAAAGYRMAAESPLFLERYLDAPVESMLATHEPTLMRSQVVEVGHLASRKAGRGIFLMSLLGAHLAAQSYRWVVGTATSEVRQMFDRVGVEPIVLGMANPKLLGDEAGHWGSYYDHRPEVLAGHMQRSMNRLERLSQRGAG